MLNQKINGYEIKRLIGSGGMADVYYGETKLGLGAAIKVLKQEYGSNKKILERFENEAKIMKKLDHPHICKVMDLGEIYGRPFIIMEYLEGGTLKELMSKRNKLDDASLQKYFDQCAQALIYTHSKGVTHRDIKPSNIFITQAGQVKLVDFGIAKSELGMDLTNTGQTLGTIIYMSPEQVVDPKRVTGKTDIYSLGVTFYHALLGKPPYDESTGSEYKIMDDIVKQDLDLRLVPSHWREVLSGLLRKKPEERAILKSNNFKEDETIIDPDPKPDPQPPISDPPPTRSIPSWPYYLIGGVVLAMAVIMGMRSCGGEDKSSVFAVFKEKETPAQKAAAEIAATMVRIPGGTFTMGCTSEQGSDCWSEEKPAHQVTLSSFSINKYEVTLGQWEAIMGNNPSRFSGCERCPVKSVSWKDVQEFIRKLNNLTGRKYRLPTEAEWEYAARGGQDYKYSGSNNLGSVAWYGGNSSSRTHPVGSKSPNGYGLYDMSGNVYEWCSDRYGSYSSGSRMDPKGPSTGSYRVARGGSWASDARECRVSYRAGDSPEHRNYYVGFRLTLDN